MDEGKWNEGTYKGILNECDFLADKLRGFLDKNALNNGELNDKKLSIMGGGELNGVEKGHEWLLKK